MEKYNVWVTKFRVTAEIKKQLETQADFEGCSETDILRKALLVYLKKQAGRRINVEDNSQA